MKTSKLASVFWLLIGWLYLFSGCKKPEEVKQTSKPEPYPTEIATIFSKRNCLGCHASTPEFNPNNWSEVGDGVIPYAAEWSHLVWHVNTYAKHGFRADPPMPLVSSSPPYVLDSAKKLTENEVITLKNWINSGAKSASGTSLYQSYENTPKNKLFFLNQGSDRLGVLTVGLKREKVMRMINLNTTIGRIDGPHHASFSPDQKAIYLTLIGSGRVMKFSTTDYRLLATSPPIGEQAAHVQATDRWVIVTHWSGSTSTGSPKLTLLNAHDLSVSDKITGGFIDKPHGLALVQGGKYALITANGGNYIATVEIDLDKGKFTREYTITALNPGDNPKQTLEVNPYQIITNANQTRAYISAQASNEVYAFDISNPMKPTFLSKVGGVFAGDCVTSIGNNPRLMALDEKNKLLYVACRDQSGSLCGNGSRIGCISVVDVSRDQIVWQQNLYGLGHRPHGIALVNDMLYITNENLGGVTHHEIEGSNQVQGNIAIYDLKQKRLKQRFIDIGFFPAACVATATR